MREDGKNSTRRRLRGKQRNPEELTRRNQDHEAARVESRQRIPEELTRRNQDHETARVESRQRIPENMTMRDKGREKTRLRTKHRVLEDWMMRERETVDVQSLEEQSEKATSSTTTAALREQQHQMPSHVQILMLDRSRRINVVRPKLPRDKKEAFFKRRGTGEMHVLWIGAVGSKSQVLLRPGSVGGLVQGSTDQISKKYTDRQRDAMRYACQYCHHKSPGEKLHKRTTLHALAGGSSQACL